MFMAQARKMGTHGPQNVSKSGYAVTMFHHFPRQPTADGVDVYAPFNARNRNNNDHKNPERNFRGGQVIAPRSTVYEILCKSAC